MGPHVPVLAFRTEWRARARGDPRPARAIVDRETRRLLEVVGRDRSDWQVILRPRRYIPALAASVTPAARRIVRVRSAGLLATSRGVIGLADVRRDGPFDGIVASEVAEGRPGSWIQMKAARGPPGDHAIDVERRGHADGAVAPGPGRVNEVVSVAEAAPRTCQRGHAGDVVMGAILVVATLITGVCGMNLRIMPELSSRLGYPFAIALIVGSTGVLYRLFRSRGWL